MVCEAVRPVTTNFCAHVQCGFLQAHLLRAQQDAVRHLDRPLRSRGLACPQLPRTQPAVRQNPV